jgi:hypothetical protein
MQDALSVGRVASDEELDHMFFGLGEERMDITQILFYPFTPYGEQLHPKTGEDRSGLIHFTPQTMMCPHCGSNHLEMDSKDLGKLNRVSFTPFKDVKMIAHDSSQKVGYLAVSCLKCQKPFSNLVNGDEYLMYTKLCCWL